MKQHHAGKPVRALHRLSAAPLLCTIGATGICGVALAFGSTLAPAQADTPASCLVVAGFDPQTASPASLQACGITAVPLSSTVDLSDGGYIYQYELPDGQVASYPQTPPNFDALTATTAEDEQYGLGERPAAADTSYPDWAQRAAIWRLDPGDNPYIYVYDDLNNSGLP